MTNLRKSVLNQSIGLVDTFNIVVSERVNMKKDLEGNTEQFFIVHASANADLTYPKVEKTYQDFKNLEMAINNSLRSNDIE